MSTWRFDSSTTEDEESGSSIQNIIVDLLWSDPHPDGKLGLNLSESLRYDKTKKKWTGEGFNSTRGTGTWFGPDVIKSFCKRNGLDLVIRSHMCVNGGMQLAGKRCVTVFSAPKYGNHDNAGAIVEISRDFKLVFKALSASDSKSQWANDVELDVPAS